MEPVKSEESGESLLGFPKDQMPEYECYIVRQ